MYSSSLKYLIGLGILFFPTESASQRVTIVRGFEGMRNYVVAAQSETNPDLAALFRDHVVNPYWDSCAQGARYESLVTSAIDTPIEDLAELSKAVETIDTSGVEALIADALEDASSLLPGGPTTVCVFAADPKETFILEAMNGVTGFSPGAGRIWLQIYPGGGWLDEVAAAVAHEYHHSVSFEMDAQNPSRPIDLLDSILLEGRADSFAALLYPEKSYPWTEALSPEQEHDLWNIMQSQLRSTDEEIHNEFLFGSPDLPHWGGYTIGFHIVQAYLRGHPNVSVTDWTGMGAHELLEQSGYIGNH